MRLSGRKTNRGDVTGQSSLGHGGVNREINTWGGSWEVRVTLVVCTDPFWRRPPAPSDENFLLLLVQGGYLSQCCDLLLGRRGRSESPSGICCFSMAFSSNNQYAKATYVQGGVFNAGVVISCWTREFERFTPQFAGTPRLNQGKYSD